MGERARQGEGLGAWSQALADARCAANMPRHRRPSEAKALCQHSGWPEENWVEDKGAPSRAERRPGAAIGVAGGSERAGREEGAGAPGG